MTDPIPVYPAPQLNINTLVTDLRTAGLPVAFAGWQSDLTPFYVWTARPTPAQFQQAAEIVAAHNPAATSAETSRINYETNTATSDKADALLLDIAAEITYLTNTVASIDTFTAAQVRDVVKRLCQENLRIVKVIRFVINRLT